MPVIRHTIQHEAEILALEISVVPLPITEDQRNRWAVRLAKLSRRIKRAKR